MKNVALAIIGLVAAVAAGFGAFTLQPGTAGFTHVVVQILEPWYIVAGFIGLGLFAAALTLISVGRLQRVRRQAREYPG